MKTNTKISLRSSQYSRHLVSVGILSFWRVSHRSERGNCKSNGYYVYGGENKRKSVFHVEPQQKAKYTEDIRWKKCENICIKKVTKFRFHFRSVFTQIPTQKFNFDCRISLKGNWGELLRYATKKDLSHRKAPAALTEQDLMLKVVESLCYVSQCVISQKLF